MLVAPARTVVVLALLLAASPAGTAADTKKENAASPVPTPMPVSIPRVDRPPVLEDFLDMAPANGMAAQLAKVENFIQRDPKDGEPATQRTEAYFGYDDKNLYAIFVAFDASPNLIRAHMTRREAIWDDDVVQILLDTFQDRRRAYFFVCNPYGIQADGIHTEGQGGDTSFDTLWSSEGRLTPQGYIVRMAIPFRSLRFHPAQLNWGMILERRIPRLNERHFWPRVSSRVTGLLNQGGDVNGMRQISPGRNIQLIPYGAFRSFRAVDSRDPAMPVFEGKSEFDGGLDAKFVLKDRFVFDMTVNPDFAQVESDQPQVTVNQRFEVYYPEKRPFFLENASFFNTPIELVFTRRIADPQFGARMTGKVGRYAVGILWADDQSPGRSVLASDPLAGNRAYFTIARVNRDIFKNSTVGVIYTERRFQNEHNRVGGVDFRFKFPKNWVAEGQAVTSSTKFLNGTTQGGPAYQFWAGYSDRKAEFNTMYMDNSVGFLTQTGFFRRPDIRRFSNFSRYRWRPEGKRLISHGPSAFQLALWDHNGLGIEEFYNANYFFEFARQTEVGVWGNVGYERLRPADFSTLTSNQRYTQGHRGFFFYTAFFKQLSMWMESGWGRSINFGPPVGPPVSARSNFVATGMTVRPLSRLTIDNSYRYTRLRPVDVHAAIFNDHILRSKWNYQFTRELSARFIAQYQTTLANGNFSPVDNPKNFNVDFLVTYLLHPGTAVYVGYNSNLQNLDPSLTLAPSGSILRTRRDFINDGRTLFVKVSYLLRF